MASRMYAYGNSREEANPVNTIFPLGKGRSICKVRALIRMAVFGSLRWPDKVFQRAGQAGAVLTNKKYGSLYSSGREEVRATSSYGFKPEVFGAVAPLTPFPGVCYP
jgi:hypothetical protein